MKITKLYPGSYYCNCYVVGEEGEPCFIIDPGCNNNGYLDRYIAKHHAGKVLGIFLTHGHWDHIGGLETLQHKATVFIHSDDLEYFWEPELSCSASFIRGGATIDSGLWDIYEMCDDDEISIGGVIIDVIHTPFHTGGSVCLYIKEENVIFTGDTLFKLSVGRSDLKGGCRRYMEQSLMKLKELPPETKVYPGHDRDTTIGNELMFNSYLK
ncbi:MAG: MBL fold metallo-hydrolase [Bacilli bacterium]|nr:MBL fold metallo-hydrolase [Bacilli bacterium]